MELAPNVKAPIRRTATAARRIAGWGRVSLSSALVAIGSLAGAARAESAPATPAGPWTFNLYLQEAFPKQTRTNQQIDEINQAFGTDFDDWSDVANLSVGSQLLWRVDPRWKVGFEVDYSQGEVSGKATIATEAGPARLSFRQRYSTFADLLAAAHFLPCPDCRLAQPFVLLGAGLAYESDRTTLTLTNDFLDERLLVENDGYYPVYTVGLGVDLAMTSSGRVFLQFGSAYFWGRSRNTVAASGSLAPSPRVEADTDSTGPNVWIGLSWRFGGRR